MHPLGLYIHIPFCVRKCNYCDFPSVAGKLDLLPAYLDALHAELGRAADQWEGYRVQTIFLGGGTPSLLPADAYGLLLDAIRKAFPVAADAEISLEANPGTVTREKAQAMRAAGFNRVSLGVQAAQDELLRAMGRIHRRKDAEEAIGLLLDAGFGNLNLDLMFGLPGQTFSQWQESLRFATAFPTTHVSFYSLSIEAGTPWGDLYERKQLEPAPDELDRRMYHEACDFLARAGYLHYEISNAAKPGLLCRHNLIYWNRGEYLGLGAGAHSLMGNRRFANVADPEQYILRQRAGTSLHVEEQTLTAGDVLSERLFMGFRLLAGLDLAQVGEETGIDVARHHAQALGTLTGEGLLETQGAMTRLTTRGLDYANRVFRAFV
jgi:oxygen-independent coproporphyrinogen-3 oxidase